MKKNILVIVWVVLVLGCNAKKFTYPLHLPDKNMELSSKLDEISGLEMLSDSVLAAVQDEKGRIYLLDANTGGIIDHFDFAHKGDYEGIAHRNNHFYVLRSDGTIFKAKQGKKTKEYAFKDNKNFDFEGLCVDAKNNRLLVACKTHGNKKKRDHFYIYGFSLETHEFEVEPVFKIKRDEVDSDFKPSGIAIHPKGSIYILSSYSKSLLVLSPKGRILNNVDLKESIFYQPEGITFNANGDLFISNEKNDQVPTVLKFKRK